jgi:hypothetical protein
MLPTERTVFFELDPIGVQSLVLGVGVVAALALAAGKDNSITRHLIHLPNSVF